MKTPLKLAIIVAFAMPVTRVNSQSWSLTGNAGTNPSLNFIGTTDNHSFVIRSNNTNRIFVDSTGKVGIGTSTPSAQLHFSGGKFTLNATSTTASSLIKSKYKLEIQNGTTSTTFATFDAVNQRVGIGTTTPTTPLDVNGIITAAGGNSTNWNTAFGWGNHAAAGYLTSETDPQVGSNTTSFVPRWNGSALIAGSIFDNGTSIGIGTTTVTDSRFIVEQTGTALATAKFLNTSKGPNISWVHFGINGDWYLRSAANAGNVILQDQTSGNVGIGTASPGVKLHVNAASAHVAKFESTLNNSYISFYEAGFYRGYIGSFYSVNNVADVDFGTGNTNTTGKLHLAIKAVPKLTVDTSGFVGIGTQTPARIFETKGSSNQYLRVSTTSTGTGTSGTGIEFVRPNGFGSWRIAEGSNIGTSNDDLVIERSSDQFATASKMYTFSIFDRIYPESDGISFLGVSNHRWSQVWASDGTIQTSDVRQKKNIVNLKYGLNEVMKLNPISFRWKNNDNGRERIGFSAQELLKIIPEVVEIPENENTPYGVRYAEIIPVLANAIKEQQQQIEMRNAQLKSLQQSVEELKNCVNTLCASNEKRTTEPVNETKAYLKQNHPNPFSNSTVIEYYIPEKVNSAAMLITDLTGKQIRKIELNGRGNSSVEIDLSNYAQGIYQFSLIIDGKKIDSGKMELAR